MNETHEILSALQSLPPEKITEVRDFAVFLSERFGNGKTVGKVAASHNPAVILTEIARLPIEGDTNQFSGREHDQILYPEKTAK